MPIPKTLLVALTAMWLRAPGAEAKEPSEHALGVGYTYDNLWVASGPPLAFHGLDFSYGFEVGHAVVALGALSAGLPLAGRDDGASFSLREIYDITFDADLWAGAGYRWQLTERLAVVAGGGVHLRYLDLNAPEVQAIEHLAFGVVAVGRVSWAFRGGWTLQGEALLGLDPADFVHGGDLRVGLLLRPSIRVGYRFGGVR